MELLFFFFSSMVLTSGLIVITARNPIHSVLFMILVFVNVVCMLIFLEAEFLALTFVIVYVGAVAVLFLFVVMMLNIKIIELNKELIHYFPIGSAVGFVFLFNIFIILVSNGISSPLNLMLATDSNYLDWFSNVDSLSNIEVIGLLVYTNQIYFFIMSGLVLLVAMIGAIILTIQNKDKDVRVQQVFHQLSRSSRNAIFMTSLKG
jgi:NADH-quinone oxidoreductase subunit J